MLNCIYQRTGDGTKANHAYRCLACGHARESNHPPELLHRWCPKEDIPDATEAAGRLGLSEEDAKRFRGALAQWAREGFPERDPDEATWILSSLCAVCPKRKGDHCGCCRARGMPPLTVAVRMTTTACPGLKW